MVLKQGLMALTLVVMAQRAAFSAEDVQIESKALKNATHFEFSGRDEWRYDISRGPKKISVQFTGIKPSSFEKLRTFKDARLKGVKVDEGINGDAVVTFALADHLNLFDYQTDAPVHLIFDIFQDEKSKGKKKPAKQAMKDSTSPTHFFKKPARDVASVDHPDIGQQPLLDSSLTDPKAQYKFGIFDGGDPNMNRFKILPGDITPASQDIAAMKATRNLYVHFPALQLERPALKTIVSEGLTRYEAPEGDGDEALQVKFLVKLFKEGKYAVVLRTLKFFREKYPTSKFDQLLESLTADTYFKLWERDGHRSDFETAMTRYKEILNKYPDDPSKFHTLMVIGLNYLYGGDLFAALSTFQVGVQKFPESPFIWEMRLAEAEILKDLSNPKESLNKLNALENDNKAGSFALEATLRRGDVFFKMKDYQEAIKEYKKVMDKHPDQLSLGPNLFFNTAESQFWLKNYRDSLDTYREFLRRFPNHPYGGYAMTRIGEIFEMMGVSSGKVNGALLESYYRYRGTLGAFMAKFYINMSRFPQMKTKEVEAVVTEVQADMPTFSKVEDVDPFVTLNLAKGYSQRGDFKTSMDLLVKYYKKNVLSPYLPIFKDYITQTITREMARQLEEGHDLPAVETYLAHRDSWLKNSPRIDTPYVLGQAYEHLNLFEEASKAYETALNSFEKMTPDQIRNERKVEKIPSPDEINLRMAATALKADSLKKVTLYLAAIKDPESLSEPQKVEKALILSGLSEKEERSDLALQSLKDLNEHWKGKPELLADAWLRMAKLEANQNHDSVALTWAEKVKDAAKTDKNVRGDTFRGALELAGDLENQMGHSKKAVEMYKAYLDHFGSNEESAAVEYKLGKIFFDQNDLRSAGEIWGKLKTDDKGKIWAKMANEALAQAKWDAQYGRYLDGRRPASEQGGKN